MNGTDELRITIGRSRFVVASEQFSQMDAWHRAQRRCGGLMIDHLAFQTELRSNLVWRKAILGRMTMKLSLGQFLTPPANRKIRHVLFDSITDRDGLGPRQCFSAAVVCHFECETCDSIRRGVRHQQFAGPSQGQLPFTFGDLLQHPESRIGALVTQVDGAAEPARRECRVLRVD